MKSNIITNKKQIPAKWKEVNPIYDFDLIFSWNKEEWYDIGRIIHANPWIRFYWCVGDNGIGKSYSVENLALECVRKYLVTGKVGYLCGPVIWNRNTVEESKSCKNEFLSKIDTKTMEVNAQGVWRKGKARTMPTDGKQMDWSGVLIAFTAFSASDTTIPQNIKARLVVSDEFMGDPNNTIPFIFKDPLKSVRKLVSRTCRPLAENEMVPVIFIANPNKIDADLLSDFELEIDLNKTHSGIDQIEVDLDRGLVFTVFPMQFHIKENLGLMNFWRGFKNSKPENYYFPSAGFRRICWEKPEDAHPIFNITFGGEEEEFVVYLYDNDSRIWIAKLSKHPECENLLNFTIEEDSQNYHNLYIPKNKLEYRWDKLHLLITAWIEGNVVYYDSIYTRDTLVEMKRLIQTTLYTLIQKQDQKK